MLKARNYAAWSAELLGGAWNEELEKQNLFIAKTVRCLQETVSV